MTLLWMITLGLGLISAALGAGRWLRVAQREHYIAQWVTRIAFLWLRGRPINVLLAALAFALVLVAIVGWLSLDWLSLEWAAPVAVLLLAFFPVGLGVRGRTAPLAWTARMKRLLVFWIVIVLAVGGILSLVLGPAGIPLAVLIAPALTDLGLAILAPLEKRLSRRFLVSARKRLGQVRPTIVAITGSYGKTSTKGYLAHVLSGSFSVVASPASFNNLMGLSRAVNERVIAGTEVFIAEMGMYARGEIRELSASFPPDIAAITTIGEAHLARMGSREAIFEAKSEITERAGTVVLPVDETELAALAERCRAGGKRVVTVSTLPGTTADVVLDEAAGRITVLQNGIASSAPVAISGTGHAVNVAVTVGIALALTVDLAVIAERLTTLPASRHRAEIQYAASGVVIIDDTYNSNPVGAERALREAVKLAVERGGSLVVVTPGMVELGPVQKARNEVFAASVAAVGGHLFAIARTNRAALIAGGSGGQHPVRSFDQRSDAVPAALDQAGERGVILYENDLPDHYP